jgi:hypothetical protein
MINTRACSFEFCMELARKSRYRGAIFGAAVIGRNKDAYFV